MVEKIQAKTLLSRVKQPDNWFGLKYNMNLYRGCQHQCIYCDSRSECYQIEDFSHIQAKSNAIGLLRNELSRKRIKGTIGTGSMNDPYMPVEKSLQLTRQALEAIAQFRFPVHVITKGALVLRDLDVLRDISRVYAAVSFSMSTADDALGKKLEPGAPPVSERFAAIKTLSDHGIYTGITMMPILPFISDTEENITEIVTRAHASGASYIISWFGMSLRDRQRAYYYNKLDKLFPGLRQKYQQHFGEQYGAPAQNARQLERLFRQLCHHHGIATRLTPYPKETATQLSLF